VIRFPIKLNELRDRIEQHKPGWLRRAADRTRMIREEGRYDETSSIWSEVKAVYMRLQGNKCA